MLLGLGDRRVAASTGPEPVAGRVKRRLEQRFENLPHGLHHHPVDHARDPQSALPAARLGDHRPANPARSITPGQQRGAQHRGDRRPLLAQFADRRPVRPWGALVRDHLLHRRIKSRNHLLHHRQRAVPLGDDRLRHPRSACPGPDPDCLASGPLRVFCCRDRQLELHRRLLDRDRLPLPDDGLSGHYPAVRYYAVLRLLLGHRPSFPPAYRR